MKWHLLPLHRNTDNLTTDLRDHSGDKPENCIPAALLNVKPWPYRLIQPEEKQLKVMAAYIGMKSLLHKMYTKVRNMRI